MTSENTIQRQIWLALGKLSCLFRVNTGRAWISGNGPKGVRRLPDGSVVVTAARSIAMGFSSPSGDTIVGAADLAGWTTVKITPEMVGRDVAVYTSIECKNSKGGRATPEQLNWQNQVRNNGGIAGIVNNPDDALLIIDEWKRKQ
jgi:hypothetical protein